MSLLTEINQQPQVLQEILDKQFDSIAQIANRIQAYQPHYIFLAARGTSDNAGRYANYLWGAHNQYPLALATPSLFTFYQQPPQLKGALVVANLAIRDVSGYCGGHGRRKTAGQPDTGNYERCGFTAGKVRGTAYRFMRRRRTGSCRYENIHCPIDGSRHAFGSFTQ